ncbi:MAG: MarR family transcriptional regulator [Oscillospiraceae bacterium]|nr:MarR family transcriptional regulator [Oscillospiraceae bacterium]
MNEKWTGNLVGKMHNERVTIQEIAEELGVTKSYVSMILNGARKPKGIKERMELAFSDIVERRKEREGRCR